MDFKDLAKQILGLVGGSGNVTNAFCCMTRLRINVKDPSKVQIKNLQSTMGVLGVVTEGAMVQVVIGPGKVKKVTDEFVGMLDNAESEATADKVANSEATTGVKKKWTPMTALRHVGNIFSPAIPGFIVYGVCVSISVLIKTFCFGATADPTTFTGPAGVFYWLFQILGQGFFAYLAIFVGFQSAKEFRVSHAIGTIIGGISILPELVNISAIIGWITVKDGEIVDAIIKAGKGGVIAVILAVWLIGYLERFIRKHIPDVLDTVFTPLLTVVIGGSIFIFGFMPVMGFASYGIGEAVKAISMNPNIVARIVIGFFLAALFLPLVMLGLHHAFVPIYTDLFKTVGYTTLFPVFAMADAAHVGVGIALYIKARRTKHDRLKMNTLSGVVPCICGVSEPLIYGATMPLAKPFVTVGLGAGIGGAFLMSFQVGCVGFGASGLMAIPMMQYVNGVSNPPLAMGLYSLGWAISVVFGFIFTMLMIGEKTLNRMPKTIYQSAITPPPEVR